MPTWTYRPLVLALALVGGACAHRTAAEATTTARGEPLPEPRSFAPDGASVLLRFETARMRGLPFERELASIVTSAGTWEHLGYGSESDPIRDLDVMVCMARPLAISVDGIVADRWTFVLAHPHDDDTVRRRFGAMALASDRPIAWTGLEGFDTARLPVPESGFVEHAIVLSAPHEVVIAPVDELPRILARADEHRRLRHAGAGLVDPSLEPTSDDELAYVELVPAASDRATIPLPDGSETARVERLVATIRRVDAQLVGLVELGFGSSDDAARAELAIRRAITRAREDRAVRMLGLGELAGAIASEASGTTVRYRVALDDRQAALVLSLAALVIR